MQDGKTHTIKDKTLPDVLTALQALKLNDGVLYVNMFEDEIAHEWVCVVKYKKRKQT